MLWQSSFWCYYRVWAASAGCAVSGCGAALSSPARWSESWRLGARRNCFRDHYAGRAVGLRGQPRSDRPRRSRAIYYRRPHVSLNATGCLASALIGAADRSVLSQRADNALIGEDELPSAVIDFRLGRTTTGLLRHSSRQVGDMHPALRPGHPPCRGRFASASGDPVGDHRAWPQATDAWLRPCQTYGWHPADGRQFKARHIAKRPTALERGDEPSCGQMISSCPGPRCGAPGRDARARRAGLTVCIRRHRDIAEDDEAASHGRIPGATSISSVAFDAGLGDPADRLPGGGD